MALTLFHTFIMKIGVFMVMKDFDVRFDILSWGLKQLLVQILWEVVGFQHLL